MEFGLPSNIQITIASNTIDESPQSYYSDSDIIPSNVIDEFEKMSLHPDYIISDTEEEILYDPDNIEDQRHLDEL